jgi:hypothetical protein
MWRLWANSHGYAPAHYKNAYARGCRGDNGAVTLTRSIEYERAIYERERESVEYINIVNEK